MKYTVVVASSCIELIDKVNALLVKGWAPQGGLAMTVVNNNYSYCQACMLIEK